MITDINRQRLSCIRSVTAPCPKGRDWATGPVFSMFEKSLEKYSTHTLHTMRRLISAELENRENGRIPIDLACGVCGYEMEGDRYEFDENAFACHICYESKPEVQKDVAEWEAWVLEYKAKRTDELTKELDKERRLMEYYRSRRPEKFLKHAARVEEIERELEEIGI